MRTGVRLGRPDSITSDVGDVDRPAKFLVPVAMGVIDRPRLHARLNAGLAGGATLVAATAGWGKTLLVGSWVSGGAGGRAPAWVSLEPVDDDERVFWRTLAAALLPMADVAAREGLRSLIASPPDGRDLPAEFAASLRGARQPMVAVLDNLHEVRSPEVHAGLLRLIERPLPALSLLATTRQDPPWPLQRLRLAGLLTEVRAADLAFQPDEAAELFAQLRLHLSVSQLGRLVERTEGWAAGLRLAALHLGGCQDVEAAVDTFSGDAHSVARYLLHEVLQHQPPDLVAFLEQISVVDLVTAGLADALTGGNDGEAMLAALSASHLFVEAVGRPGRWYRLHRLVVDVLRARPMRPRLRRDLHRRAAEWFRDHGMPLEAIRSALQGELWRLAGELVAINLAPLVLRGSAHELERLLNEIPGAMLLERPELAVGLAAARITQGLGTEVSGLIEAARAGASQLGPVRAARVKMQLELIVAARARMHGDLDTAVTAFRRIPRQPAAWSRLGMAEPEIISAVVMSNLGTAQVWTGDLDEAAGNLRAASDPRSAPPAFPHLNAAAHLALLHSERGELTVAETLARQAAATAAAQGWARTGQAACAYLAMSRVLLDRDELTAFDDWLRQVEEVLSVVPQPHLRLASAILMAERREAAGDRQHALSGLAATAEALAPWVPPRSLAEQWLLTEAAMLARSGAAASAHERLGTLGRPRTATGAVAAARVRLLLGAATAEELSQLPNDDSAGPRTKINANLVSALAALVAGDGGRALDRLEEALVTAAPSGMRQPFLAEALQLRELLQWRVERGTATTAFAVDLLDRMAGGSADELAGRRPVIDPLTDREQTILRYLGSTLSTAEIAGELYLSVNTVKTHQQAVYRKLGANRRRDAVRRARQLHLL